MREIKFRAWNIPNKYMYNNVQDGVIAENEKGELIIGLSFGKLCRDKGSIVMQYTGLKDRRNSEIYIGDIIQVFNNLGEFSYRFEVDSLYEIYNNSLVDESSFGKEIERFEIIGNIYENPEYLTNKK